MTTRPSWPVLRSYDGPRLARVAMPLGGIGTGTVGLGGRGDLRDWELTNRPGKGFSPGHGFFAVRAHVDGADPVARALEGPLDPSQYEGAFGVNVHDHGLPRFRRAVFSAAYPLAQISLEDPSLPLDVRLEAYNPLVPADVDASSLPVAVFRYVITNTADAPADVSVCGTMTNFVGRDGSGGTESDNANEARHAEGLTGVLLRSRGVPSSAERWGTLALTTTDPDDGVSSRAGWADVTWGDSLLDFWDDFIGDGRLDDRRTTLDAPVASLASSRRLAPGECAEFTFLLAWHFPNRHAWAVREGSRGYSDEVVGNHYTTRYDDAWDAAVSCAAGLDEWERRTVGFVAAFCASDLPPVVKEAALFNVSTLRSQTFFRTPDGHFYGWEGCADTAGSCPGNCTHVWNYEQATAFLFGEVSRDLREIEFAHATDDDGRMSFRVGLPLDRRSQDWGIAAADGQMGCLVKLYRDWQLSGDDAMLRRLWPQAKRALEFCWIQGGWDADRDGVMEGAQHNTMDVEYYGPNPQMGTWYLAALHAVERMAEHLGDADLAATCRELYVSGARYLDQTLFNGDYYEHRVVPAGTALIADGLRAGPMGTLDLDNPELQLGPGCLVDQLVGQFLAHVCGLGAVVDPANAATALEAVYRHNFREQLWGHFNHMRSFAVDDEAGVLMATYPRGNRPDRPFPYYNEIMTGFEYTAAIGMIYEGQTKQGLRIIQAVRDRYDGARRNPFNEAECGHHYARAMASWAGVLALTGFRYSAVTGTVRFTAATEPTQWFFSTGDAWGTITQRPDGDTRIVAELNVIEGDIGIAELVLAGAGSARFDNRTVGAGESIRAVVPVHAS